MRDLFTVPNLICYFRVLLAFAAFVIFSSNHNQCLFFLLTVVVIVLDGIDGIVARLLKQETTFGAKLDIWSDRIVELAYWLYFALIHRLHLWVFAFFLLRGLAVDILTSKSDKPLGDSWLRSSRFMRAAYGMLKLVSFALLILYPQLNYFGFNLTLIIVYLTVLVCFLRAVPVISNLL